MPLVGDPASVLFWRAGAFSDLLISHWPNAEYLRLSLSEWGQLPLWNSTILSGAPFAADPLAGLWYLPNWLAVVLHPAAAFNLLIWMHLAWASIGTWRLARSLGASNHASLIAGLAFGASPKLVGHAGLGHVSLIFAVSWTPWVLQSMAAAVNLRSASAWRRLRSAALAGSSTGLVFLADPRWYPPILALSAAFLMWRLAHRQTIDGGKPNGNEGAQGSAAPSAELQALSRAELRPISGRLLGSLAVGIASSLGTAAVLALPLVEFVGLSTRLRIEAAEATVLSLPLGRLSGVLGPEVAAWPEWQLYPGMAVLLLAVLGATGRAPGRWFWSATAIVSLLVSLGDSTPLYGVLRVVLPGFSQLRVPPRALFVTGFSLSMLAASGFDRIDRRRIRVAGSVVITAATVLGIAAWLEAPADERALRVAPWILSVAFSAIAVLWANTARGKRLVVGWGLIILLDLGLVNLTTLEARQIESSPSAEIASDLVKSHQRVFSPSYSVPQPSAAESGLELADGVNPLQLAAYRDHMVEATSLDATSYSVTLPPFPGGDIRADWGFDPDADRLGILGVSLLVSAYPIDDEEFEFLQVADGLYYYRNPMARPRSWIESPGGTRPVQEFLWSPNNIRIRTQEAGRLILSELAYPGWIATIDGHQVEIETYRGILRSIELPPGAHRVELAFRPASVFAGMIISALTLLVLATLWIRK
jgi:hypothetical protein